MPYNDPDPTDPNTLVGVVLPANAEATRDMAYVLAEEFARMGYGRDRLLWLFKNPFYGGAHGAYQALGENEIVSIIDECINAWGRNKVTVQDVEPAPSSSVVSRYLVVIPNACEGSKISPYGRNDRVVSGDDVFSITTKSPRGGKR